MFHALLLKIESPRKESRDNHDDDVDWNFHGHRSPKTLFNGWTDDGFEEDQENRSRNADDETAPFQLGDAREHV